MEVMVMRTLEASTDLQDGRLTGADRLVENILLAGRCMLVGREGTIQGLSIHCTEALAGATVIMMCTPDRFRNML